MGEIKTPDELREFVGHLSGPGWALVRLGCGCPGIAVWVDAREYVPAAGRACVEIRPVDLSDDDDPHEHDSQGWCSSRGVEYPLTVLYCPSELTPSAVAQLKAEALREAANAWTQGGWIGAPKRAERVAERIAAGQFAGDWMRARAEDVEAHG